MSETTDAVESIATTLKEAKDRLAQAEQIVAVIPQLRREIKILEKAHRGLSSTPTPRRNSGPTIKDSIFEALHGAGGRIEFEQGEMLKTIHAITGGKPNSVQVELHRLRRSGNVVVDRDDAGKIVALSLAPAPLKVVTSPEEDVQLQG